VSSDRASDFRLLDSPRPHALHLSSASYFVTALVLASAATSRWYVGRPGPGGKMRLGSPRLHGFAPGPCRSLRCCLDSWLSHSPRGALGRLTPKVYEATPDPPPRERCQDHGTPCCGQARTPLGRHHSPAARTVRAAAVALYLARPLLCHPDSSPAFAPEFDQTPSPAPNHSGSRVLKHFLPERSSVQPTSALRPEATQ